MIEAYKSTGVVVPHCLSIPEGLQKRVGLQNDVFDMLCGYKQEKERDWELSWCFAYRGGLVQNLCWSVSDEMRSVGNDYLVAWIHWPEFTPHILVCVHIPHRICTASSTLSSQEMQKFWDIQYHHWLWHYTSHLQVLIKHIKCKYCIKIFLRNLKLKVTLLM